LFQYLFFVLMSDHGVSIGRLIGRILIDWFFLSIIGVLIYVLYINIVFYLLPQSWKAFLSVLR